MATELFDGPFPANMPESERFRTPKPDHIDAEKQMSGNLEPSSDPVDDGPKPFKDLTSGR